jgi:hypothetical protein
MKIDKSDKVVTNVNNRRHGKLLSTYNINKQRCTISYIKWGKDIGLDIWYSNTEENSVYQIQYYL